MTAATLAEAAELSECLTAARTLRAKYLRAGWPTLAAAAGSLALKTELKLQELAKRQERENG